ncbi:hypothetical protein AB0O28_39085 [Microbispora sp. NPDC088329]|uniref:hypothetical protein n=1 Tax=Microbispora sp. NPDC088329 TaxID=3154869 RepID=UPI0034373E32
MGSKTATKATTAAVREGGVVTYKGGILSDLVAKAAHVAAPHTVPWLLGAGLMVPAYGLHEMWGASPWAAAGLTVSGGVVTAATWLVSRWRHVLGRVQSTGTAAAASGYLLAATITGPTAHPTIDLWIWAGGTLAALWNVRNIIRPKIDPEGTMLAPGGPGSLFKALFTDGQDQVQVEAVRNVKVSPTAIKGTVELGGGDTTDDLQKALAGIEAKHGLPVGSLTATVNRNNAGQPTVTLSNPLLLENPIPWPGPSAAGESVAKPLQVAMFQDGSTFGLGVVGQHLQVMGMTGAAKTTAIAWGIWGEFVTRKDGALVVVDITKGEQTVAPARPALHGAVTKKPSARDLFTKWLPEWAAERLAEFGDKGLIAWEEDCGYTYLEVWLEEAADVFEHIDMEEFINLARMLRSAGGGFAWSLQRADHTQMPTIVKGQGGGKICGGVESAHDAGWGLTDEQEKAEAHPEQWRSNYPGMAYADAQGVPRDRIAMPMRFYDWGPTNRDRVANFAAHCAQYPASARPVDPITAKLLARIAGAKPAAVAGGERQEDEMDDDVKVTGVTREYLAPDPELDADDAANPIDPEAPLQDVPDIPLGGPKMSPEDARMVLNRTLAGFADGRPFGPADLGGVLASTGLSRPWLQKQLKARIEAGELAYDPEEKKPYRVRVLAPAA